MTHGQEFVQCVDNRYGREKGSDQPNGIVPERESVLEMNDVRGEFLQERRQLPEKKLLAHMPLVEMVESSARHADKHLAGIAIDTLRVQLFPGLDPRRTVSGKKHRLDVVALLHAQIQFQSKLLCAPCFACGMPVSNVKNPDSLGLAQFDILSDVCRPGYQLPRMVHYSGEKDQALLSPPRQDEYDVPGAFRARSALSAHELSQR
jgi:hypothetical protein